MFKGLEVIDRVVDEATRMELKATFRREVGSWLWRSPSMNRSYFKPHGYAGDYKLIEAMYELEYSAGNDPTQPAIVNCLEYAFSTVHSVVGVWNRRHWLCSLLVGLQSKRDSLSVLDFACGGARYIKDFFERVNLSPQDPSVSVTLVDQDPCAIHFARDVALSRWKDLVKPICMPIAKVDDKLDGQRFDVIISSGLFDYLDETTARVILSIFSSHLRVGGTIAITNFHKDDESALCKQWGADWNLIFRDEAVLRSLFPSGLEIETQVTKNRSLILANACLKEPGH